MVDDYLILFQAETREKRFGNAPFAKVITKINQKKGV
jgi:hypothetical protein